MNELFREYEGEPLYIQIYMHYRDRIINGTLKHGEKLPSIRKCAAEFGVSKMTVESAYMQLVAEGYVYTKSQSGYYVCKLSDLPRSAVQQSENEEAEKKKKFELDLSGSSADVECFDFKLWQKYIKNALRCEERLLSYGEQQGEYDLREALCDYARTQRGVVCTPSQIVIGAGVQNLIYLLCSLQKERSSVIFNGNPFQQGTAVFEDCGYTVFESMGAYDGKSDVSFIYTSPSHYNGYSVMSISDRIDLLNFARESGSIVIEDDFDSEFCYFSRPVPSLQGLDGGEHVAYIGTMSRLLLPSIRISFMVLPLRLMDAYRSRGALYNQTASKTEQIALARYITDGRLVAQIKKARKICEEKTELMKREIEREFNPVSTEVSDSGFIIRFTIYSDITSEMAKQLLIQKGINIKGIRQINQNFLEVFVSSAGVSENEIQKSVKMLKKTLNCTYFF